MPVETFGSMVRWAGDAAVAPGGVATAHQQRFGVVAVFALVLLVWAWRGRAALHTADHHPLRRRDIRQVDPGSLPSAADPAPDK